MITSYQEIYERILNNVIGNIKHISNLSSTEENKITTSIAILKIKTKIAISAYKIYSKQE